MAMNLIKTLSLAALLVTTGAVILTRPASRPIVGVPELVHLAESPFAYHPSGEFRIGTMIVDVPVKHITAPALSVMKYQVTEADYARCVENDACPEVPTQGSSTQPQTGVSFLDATAYARWLSDMTGHQWRLPTDEEWMRIAGSRTSDDVSAPLSTQNDPAQRWLASYRREVALRGVSDFIAYPQGHFGENDLGVADIGGNIWEWTDTCLQSGILKSDGTDIVTLSNYCGVRAVQGKHRAYVIDFIRDARSGGCAAGVPPDFLGFRLVRSNTKS